MVSGVGDLTFTGLVFSWFLLTGRRTDQGLELQLCAVQNLWPSYCTRSGVRITLPKINPTNPCILHMQLPNLDIQLYKGATYRLIITEYPVKGSTYPTKQQIYYDSHN